MSGGRYEGVAGRWGAAQCQAWAEPTNCSEVLQLGGGVAEQQVLFVIRAALFYFTALCRELLGW